MIFYRLSFKDGSFSGWTTNAEYITENAKYFKADVQMRIPTGETTYAYTTVKWNEI